jgi:hypothetical protein
MGLLETAGNTLRPLVTYPVVLRIGGRITGIFAQFAARGLALTMRLPVEYPRELGRWPVEASIIWFCLPILKRHSVPPAIRGGSGTH